MQSAHLEQVGDDPDHRFQVVEAETCRDYPQL